MKSKTLALLIIVVSSNAMALRAELTPDYSGVSGYSAQFLCQSKELLIEDKFIAMSLETLDKRSGVMSPEDVASANKKEQDKQKTALVKKIFQADYNGDGKVSLDEVKKYEQIRQREFDKLPKRSDGVKTDMDDPDIRISKTMKNDTNKDGIIEYNELMAANGFSSGGVMTSEAQKQVLSQQYAEQKQAYKQKQADEARKTFAALDLDKNHLHSKEECQAYGKWLGSQR